MAQIPVQDIIDAFKNMTNSELQDIADVLGDTLDGMRGSSKGWDAIEEIKNRSDLSHAKKIRELRKLYKDINRQSKALDDRLTELLKKKADNNINADELDELRDLESKKSQLSSQSRRYKNEVDSAERSRPLQNVANTLNSMYMTLRKMNDPWAQVSDKASKYAKAIGMSAEGMKALSKETLKNMTKNHIGINYNVSTEELIEMQQNYVKGIGRNVRIDRNAQENLAAMHAVMQGGEQELASAFENFGLSLNATAKHAGKMWHEASEYGISATEYSKNVASNIAIAQNYTFKNGIQGLESMAKRATAIKLSMQEVVSFANKVNTIQGSIDTAASLQVLGGSFAQIADPMQMLTEGLTDMEGLQKRVEKMIGGLGTFNKQTGEVEVSAFDKQRIKAAAEATGMSYDELMKSANRKAATNEIEKQISNGGGFGLDEKMKELVKNVGTFENGKAGVSINGEFKELSQLTNNDYEELIAETRTESDDVKQIAKDLHSLVDSRYGIKKQKDAVQAKITRGTTGAIEDSLTQAIGHQNWILGLMLGIQAIGGLQTLRHQGGQLLEGIGDLFTPFKGIGKMFKTGHAANNIGGNVARGSTKFAEETVKKGSARAATTASMKAGGNVASGLAGREAAASVGSRAMANAGTKTAAGAGAKLASNGLKVGASMGLGVIGAAGSLLNDNLVANGKIKKGGLANNALTVGSRAATWASFGMTLGPIGALAGALVGVASGLHKASKVKSEIALDNQLQSKGIERQGKYTKKQLGEIESAINGEGKINTKLRRKLERQGDSAIADEIKANKEEGKKDKIKKHISKAIFSVENATFEGVSLPKIENGQETNATVTISSIKETGQILEKVKEKASSDTDKFKIKEKATIKLDISGTIKIEGADGKQVDITKNLLNNTNFVNGITDLILKRMETKSKGNNYDAKLA